MRQRIWISGLVAALIGQLAVFSSSAHIGDKIVPSSPQPETLVTKPYLQDVTETGIAVVWETTEATIGTVDYGETDIAESSVSELEPTKNHRVEIAELEAGKIYHYRVRYGGTQLTPSRFMTAEIDEHIMPEDPLPEGLYIPPYLQNVTQQSIVVMWETTEPVIGTVEYGETESLGESVSESTPATIHEVLISGLEPGKQYHYQAMYGDTALEPSTFRTAPPDGTREAKILLYGDSRSYPKRHRRVVNQIEPFDPDIIINTGDLVASGTEYAQWKPQHFWPLQTLSHRIPTYASLGNHERNTKHYFNYLSLPGNEVYYSFDYANIHFIALDTNSGYTPYGEDSPQYRWLISDLQQHQDAEWIIVFLHHPLFRVHPGRGIESQRFKWQSVFDKYGVDLVVAGHDHHYGRIRPIGDLTSERRNGVTYITTGGGGASLYDVTEDRPYIAIARKLHNIVELTVRGDVAEAVVTDIHGNHVETFVLDKSKITAPDEYIAYGVFEVERDLRNAVKALEPLVLAETGQTLEINTEIRVATKFDVRLEGELVWNLPPVSEPDARGETDSESIANSDAPKNVYVAAQADAVVNPDTTVVVPDIAVTISDATVDVPDTTPDALDPPVSWAFDSVRTEFAINPGADLRIPVKASATDPDIYPVPSLSIHFSKIVGRLPVGFRNDVITFHPLKIAPQFPVTVPRVYPSLLVGGVPTGIHLDGNLDEPAWESATPFTRFITEQGDALAERAMWVKLLHDGTYLYAAAQIDADPTVIQDLLTKEMRARDDKYILRGEYFGIYISTPEAVYGFGVDPLGAQVDSKDDNRDWNIEWHSYTVSTDSGWVVEMAIPVQALWDRDSAPEDRGINIARWDNTAKQAAMLTPTFTLRGTENRLPEYTAGTGKHSQYPRLILQDR